MLLTACSGGATGNTATEDIVFALEELVLQCTYPSYTGKAPERLPVGQGNVSAVWGTWVDLSARTNKPIAKAAFVFPRQSPSEPTLTFTERTVRGRFRITADAG